MRLLWAVAVLALVAGLFARVAHLDRKMFFQDEAFTALRVSGHHEPLYRATYFDGRTRTAGEIRALETRDPATGVGSVVAALAAEDPHHAPLYYILDRLAIDRLGSSIAAYRAISVLFGILAIGAAYLLGVEAFGSRTGGAVLGALVAVSPLHVLYSQVAREYALFTLIVLGSSALALRVLRRPNAPNAAGYAGLVGLGMYTDPLFLLVALAHAIVFGVALRARPRALSLPLGAVALGAVSFAPWALNALGRHGNIEDQLAWGMTRYPLLALAQKWAFNLGAVFFDTEFARLALAPIALAAAAIAIVAVVTVARKPLDAAGTLGLALAAVPILAFAGRDALAGSHFATIARYLTAAWIGVEVVTATALVRAIARGGRGAGIASGAFAFLVLAGTASSVADGSYENWWTNNDQVAFQEVARIVDAAHDPTLVSEAHWHVPLVLALYLDPRTPLVLFRAPALPALPRHGSVFVVTPTDGVLAAIDARARPNARLTNVSPAGRSIIAGFHGGLRASGVTGGDDPMRPDNALWLLAPAGPGNAAPR